MNLDLEGRVALVGGASKGIGFAIAQLLAQEGADVAIVARHADAIADAATRIRVATGRNVLEVTADIGNAEHCERILHEVSARFGKLDVLVNNDGAPPLGMLMSFDDTAWGKAIERNMMSVVRLSRGAVPLMRPGGFGRIINITSLSTLQPLPRFGLSVATWAAVHAFAKTLALELAQDGITVNTICPGRIATGRLTKVFAEAAEGHADPEFLKKLGDDIPMGRVGEPEELAGLAAFLSSRWASYITGSIFHVDGGHRKGLG